MPAGQVTPMPRASDTLRELFFNGGSGPIAPVKDPRQRRFIMGEEGDDIVPGSGIPDEEMDLVQGPAVRALQEEVRGPGVRSFRDPTSGTMTYTNRGTPMRSPEEGAAEELRNAWRAEEVTKARNRVDQDLPVASLTGSAGYRNMLRDDPARAAKALGDVTFGASRLGNEPLPPRPRIPTPGEEFSATRSMLAHGRIKNRLAGEEAEAETERFMQPRSVAARVMAAGEKEAAARPGRFAAIRERLAGNPQLSYMSEDPMADLGLEAGAGAEPGGKIATIDDVREFARAQSITPEEALRAFEADGYTVR